MTKECIRIPCLLSSLVSFSLCQSMMQDIDAALFFSAFSFLKEDSDALASTLADFTSDGWPVNSKSAAIPSLFCSKLKSGNRDPI